jgi:type VI secretion system protein ImpL
MEVNRDAVQEPYASIITVQCADDEIVLENDNYPRTQNFTWSPDKCGDVNLTIEFPDVTLHKNYPGKMAFAHFLNNFIDGALRFTPEDFPEETGHLLNANIKEIVLTYSVRGQEPVLRLLELKPIVPEVITVPEQQHGGAVFN